jgi:hypothetical protein
MKIALSLLICVSISFFTCRVDRIPEDSYLLGNWEGRNTQGKIEVLLTIDTGYLVLCEDIESGKSTRHSYTLHEVFYEGARSKEIKIEGYEERFFVHLVDEETMYLGLTEADARKPDVPLISSVTFHRRK